MKVSLLGGDIHKTHIKGFEKQKQPKTLQKSRTGGTHLRIGLLYFQKPFGHMFNMNKTMDLSTKSKLHLKLYQQHTLNVIYNY